MLPLCGAVALLTACASAPPLTRQAGGVEEMLGDSTKVMVCIPLARLDIRRTDNTSATPRALFDDTFYLESINGLLRFEAAKRYALEPALEAVTRYLDSIGSHDSLPRFSRLVSNGGDSIAAARTATALCEVSGAELLLWPYACSLKHTVHQAGSWRGKGPSYERPVNHSARSTVHVQIWDRGGVLLYERIASGSKSRPLLYSLFGRRTPDDDIVHYASRLFAPPMVRSLYQAVRRGLAVER
jgi:hypothetical protein